jgi:uncharacterized protein YukE
MSFVRVDPARLADAARRFDEQGERVAALLDRYSTRMDPVVSGADPATAPLASFAPSVELHKDGMKTLQEFCFGMAERIRLAAQNYETTDEKLVEEANKLLGHVDAAMTAFGRAARGEDGGDGGTPAPADGE